MKNLIQQAIVIASIFCISGIQLYALEVKTVQKTKELKSSLFVSDPNKPDRITVSLDLTLNEVILSEEDLYNMITSTYAYISSIKEDSNLKISFNDSELEKYDSTVFQNAKFALTIYDAKGNEIFIGDEISSVTPLHTRIWVNRANREFVISEYENNSIIGELYDKAYSVRIDMLPNHLPWINDTLESIERLVAKAGKLNCYEKIDDSDIVFAKDFLLAPNSLPNGLYNSDYNACVDEWCGKNGSLYFYRNANMEYIYENNNEHISSHVIKEIEKTQGAKLFNIFDIASILHKFQKLNEQQSNRETFITELCATMPTYEQYIRLFKVIQSWKDNQINAIHVLQKTAQEGNADAQLYMGMFAECNFYNYEDNQISYSDDDFNSNYNFLSPLHWYTKSAINGNKKAKEAISLYLESNQSKDNERNYYTGTANDSNALIQEELKNYKKLFDLQLIEQEEYDKVHELLEQYKKQ